MAGRENFAEILNAQDESKTETLLTRTTRREKKFTSKCYLLEEALSLERCPGPYVFHSRICLVFLYQLSCIITLEVQNNKMLNQNFFRVFYAFHFMLFC